VIPNFRSVRIDLAHARPFHTRHAIRGNWAWWRRISSIVFLLLLTFPVLALAQGVGFVAGGTIDPEGFYAGTFFETPPFSGTIRLRPGVDGSWGDHLKIATINLDIIHRADVNTAWSFYTGGGPSVVITRVDESAAPSEFVDEVSAGFGALFGFSHSGGFLVEIKYGYAQHGSSLKIGAGFKIGPKPSTNTP
jgi:hypothetical protein